MQQAASSLGAMTCRAPLSKCPMTLSPAYDIDTVERRIALQALATLFDPLLLAIVVGVRS